MGTRQLHRGSHARKATLCKLTIDLVAIGRRIRHIRGADLTQENFARVLGSVKRSYRGMNLARVRQRLTFC
jgi:hypothetical protein